MTIALTPEFEALVQQKIAAGEYADESEVIQEALRLLNRRDELQRLRASIDLTDEQIERGDAVELTPELFSRLAHEAHENALKGLPISLDVQP